MINRVVLTGRLTHDPELRKTPSGVSVTRLGIAVDRKYIKPGEERQTDFIDVVAWRSTADFVSNYFHKGSMIAVDGSIQTNSFTDKQGNKRKNVEVVADNVSFCGSKNETQNMGGGNNYTPPTKSNVYTDRIAVDFEEIQSDDDLPF